MLYSRRLTVLYSRYLLCYTLGALYPWSPCDVSQARAIMQHNLAAAHANRGEYEKALYNLGQVTHYNILCRILYNYVDYSSVEQNTSIIKSCCHF